MTYKEIYEKAANMLDRGEITLGDFNKMIEPLNSEVQPEPHWIPVTERLPKEDGNYLVSREMGSGKESVGDCEFSVEDGYFQTAWNFDVLAWRELPEPYKGVTE